LEIALKLQQLVTSFGDSYTQVGWLLLIVKSKILPMQIAWFSYGIYILVTNEENKSILVDKILKINEIPIKTTIDNS